MKKTTLLALCLGFVLASSNSVAVNPTTLIKNVVLPGDGRQVIKQEELPEAIKKILTTDAYKGWNVKEAALITTTPVQAPAAATSTAAATTTAAPGMTASATSTTQPKAIAATPAQTAGSYYEVTLTKDKETKVVKFQKDGSLAK